MQQHHKVHSYLTNLYCLIIIKLPWKYFNQFTWFRRGTKDKRAASVGIASAVFTACENYSLGKETRARPFHFNNELSGSKWITFKCIKDIFIFYSTISPSFYLQRNTYSSSWSLIYHNETWTKSYQKRSVKFRRNVWLSSL